MNIFLNFQDGFFTVHVHFSQCSRTTESPMFITPQIKIN
jgi:hypothetical protein